MCEKNDYYTTLEVKYILFIEKLITLLETPAHINIEMKYIKQETVKCLFDYHARKREHSISHYLLLLIFMELYLKLMILHTSAKSCITDLFFKLIDFIHTQFSNDTNRDRLRFHCFKIRSTV